MEDNRPKRRELLSMRKVQLKLVSCVCFPLILACLAVSFFQTYFFLSSVRGKNIFDSQFAHEIIPIAIWVTAIVLFVLVSTCFMVAILIGHKIVGPMGRFSRRLKQMREGTIRTGFVFRDGDDLTFVAEEFAGFEDRLHADLRVCQEECKRLEGAVAELKGSGQPAAEKAVADIEASTAAIAERVAAYDLGEVEEPGEPAAETPSGEG